MDGGGTDSRPPGEQAEDVAPPGWHADPDGAPELRRWDGEHRTLESKPASTPEAEQSPLVDAESSRAPFNWPALVATLAAASIVAFFVQPPCSWEENGAFVSGPCLARYFPAAEDALVMFVAYAAAPLLVVFGLLGARRKYRSGRWVGTGLAGLGICMVAIYLFWVVMWTL